MSRFTGISAMLPVAIALLAGGTALHAQELASIELGPGTGRNIMKFTQYRMAAARDTFAPRNAQEFREFFRKPGWQATKNAHQSFGTGPETLWLRLRLDYAPSGTSGQGDAESFDLTQEYPWIDHITVFHLRPDGALRRVKGGDLIPLANRNPPARLPTMRLSPAPGENLLLLRIDSRSEKFMALRMGRPGQTAVPYLSNLHLVILGALCIAAFISLLLLLIMKERVAVSYLGFLASLGAVVLAWEGYGHYLYPGHPEWNSRVILALGFLGMFAILRFWRELLLMSLQQPLLDRISAVHNWINLAAIPLVLPAWEDQFLAEAMQLASLVVLTILIFWSGLTAIRRRFTPAYFSVIGFFFISVGLINFAFGGIWIFPANEYTRHGFYLFYLIEFSLFLVSIVVRMKFMAQIAANLESESIPVETRPAPSRLEGNDIASLSARLNRLLRVEKLFADEDLNHERLAALLGVTRHQLSELFRITYRANYHQTMNKFRVEEARNLLVEEPDRTILSIALAVGYSSKSTFNAEFKKQTGRSPSEYRKRANPAEN